MQGWMVFAAISLASCAGSARPGVHAAGRSLFAERCLPAASILTIELPRFALADRVMAAWLGEDIVLMRVGLPATANDPPAFEGAIYESCDARWSEIPAPPELPRGRGMNHQLRVVAARVVLFYYGTSIGGDHASGVLVYEPGSRVWTPVEPNGAPIPDAYLTGPHREVTVGERWIWFPEGAPHAYVLDAVRARWTAASTRGMPSAPNTFFMRALPNGLVLVPDAHDEIAGLFDPIENVWQTIPFPRLDADFNSVAVAESGSIAAIAWDPFRAWIVDPSARTVTSLPATRVSSPPNAGFVSFDGERIVYLAADRWYRFERGRWTDGSLPLPHPLHAGGAFHPISDERGHIVADHHWLVDLGSMSFQRVEWRDDIPPLGHVTLYSERHIAILGHVRTELHPYSCPPGAPCLPPDEERIEVTQAFIVPLR
jgi:hypothetical protein